MWKGVEIRENLGENFGVAKMPAAAIGGQQVQLSSFSGGKHVGVSSATQNPEDAIAFAEFLTSEAVQMLYIEMRALFGLAWMAVPSNINAGNRPEIQTNEVMSAFLEQLAHSQPQRDMTHAYWEPMENLGKMIVNGEVNAGNMQNVLNSIAAQIRK
jgi:arabinogalactan oligomer/maltooligosaccharide transport system substrate-binding protein